MKFNKYTLLLSCLVLLLGTSFVCAHDISYSSNVSQNNINMQSIQDLTSCNVTDCNSSADVLGDICVYVFTDYNNHTKKFKNPAKDVKCYLYGWKDHQLISSATTNDLGHCFLYGKTLSRYHLVVEYPDGKVVNCDIHKVRDMIYVSPTHCEMKTQYIHI